ncbi:hypothetical protein ACGE24_06565 [Corynebacterium kroppenstedtii]|uniref:GHMP family kinase ATP-binding protein n=1 Tax=Corynebacterium sp. PCR 32 TaxID=3351342 RepID=UPI003098FE64
MREGHGTCRGHHGELLQGVFTWTPSSSSRRDHESQWHGLVTLPMNSRHTRARFVPDPPHTGRAPTSTTPRGHRLRGETRRTKARRAAELALDYLATTHGLHLTGELTITSTLPSGWGMGSSTADVVATIRAVTDSAHVTLPTHHLARLAVAAEGASDPTMNNDTQGTSLFAQRKGIIFHRWNYTLPPLVVVGCRCGEPVDTEELHARSNQYSSTTIGEFDALRDTFGEALAARDAAGIGKVATRSALLNQERLHKPELDLLLDICGDCRAVGVQVAHSGSIAGILFDASATASGPQTGTAWSALHAQVCDCCAALTSLNLPLTIVERVRG